MISRLKYIAEKVTLYTRRFGWFGPILMLRLYWSYLRKQDEPVFVKLDKEGDGIWIRPLSDLGIFHQVFIHDEYGFEFEGDEETIIDAGANIGCASVYFSRRFPNAQIVAVEPTPSTFRMLERNVAARPNVKAVQAALWSKKAEIELVDEWQDHLAVRVQPTSKDSGRASVSGLPFSDFALMLGSETVDLLKMDIEGAEDDVFGCAEAWLPRVKKIVIEFHDDIRPGSTERILDVIKRVWGQVGTVVRGENVSVFRMHQDRPDPEPSSSHIRGT